MLDWLDKLGARPDHPMHSVAAAKQLLSGTSQDPLKALEEIASWLGTVTATGGYRPATRIAIVMLLDETGRSFEPQLVRQYLSPTTLREFERLHVWQVALEYWERLADAYALCRTEALHDRKTAQAFADELPLLITRELRALTDQTRLLHLRYLPVRAKIWATLFEVYRLSETMNCDIHRLQAYANDAQTSAPRHEFLRALMLDAASPESMLVPQVELAARIAARFADSFLFKTAPEAACNWAVDLDHPHRPLHANANAVAGASTRFFGAGVVIAKMGQVIERLTSNPAEKERRFGDDYSVQDKIMVLKHLKRYWGAQPPHRREARRNVQIGMVAAHGFENALHLVPRVEFSGMAEVTRGMDVKLREKLGLGLAEAHEDVPTEKWTEQNASTWGLGVKLPRQSEQWVRIGALCALKSGAQPWRIGAVRRLYRDSADHEHAGVEVLSKKPLSVWLRGIGEGVTLAENWATSSGSFAFDYLNVILLGESAASAQRNEMLLAHGQFHAGVLYEAMMGQTPPYLRLGELLEQGEDFDRASFIWVERAPSARK